MFNIGAIGDKLLRKMKDVGNSQSTFIEAKVTGISPLTLVVTGNDKWVIPESLIVVPETLTDHDQKILIKFTGTDSRGDTINKDIVTMKICNALKVGDKVICIAFNMMQSYYILDRVGV